ncbi:MAG: adenylate/guanylate cyclase domain-containing protein [Cyanobacteria bacterium P01_A01_bin.135]
MTSASTLLPDIETTTVLIVDDVIENIQVLTKLLKPEGYQIRKALSGKAALRSASQSPPDLLLLDVNMPDMNGYEVCQQFKQDPKLRSIPIIFVSALNETENKVKGFELGGTDYISKPFQASEVLARVHTHLQLYRLQRQAAYQAQLLAEKNEQLNQEIADRIRAEEKYRVIFESASEGIFQSTAAGRFITANPAIAEIYGYDSPEDLMASTTDIGNQIYVRPKRRLELIAYLNQYGKILDAVSEVYRKDGSRIWVSENIRDVKDEDGNFIYYEGTVQDVTERIQFEQILKQERQRSERLLLNVLPSSVAQRLKRRPDTIADSLDSASVLFADIVNFTPFAAQTAPKAVVTLLNDIFSAFDALVERYKLEKIKTVGDAYMVAAGVSTPMPDHLEAIAALALDMQAEMPRFLRPDGHPFSLRIGFHAGPVVAGVIGKKTFAFDLWGHTVNLASRMEETSLPGRIQVAGDVYEALHNRFQFERRGVVSIQGLGMLETYFLDGQVNESQA